MGVGGTAQRLVDLFAAEKGTPYRDWLAREGLPVYQGMYIEDLRALELAPWGRRGSCLGAYINHDASEQSNDCYVLEIPPGAEVPVQRQLFDELVYVLSGRGATTVWNGAGARCTFEWQSGSLFAIPLNAWHRHFNASGSDPVRLLSVTNAPVVFNIYKDPEFIFGTDRDFRDRFDGRGDYFSSEGRFKGYVWDTNFVTDLAALPLQDAKARGAGGRHARFRLADGALESHVSEFPVGTYKKGHKHGPGAHVIVVTGEGYSLMWPQGQPIQRFDWHEGSLVIPPGDWFHQHFNTGPTPARYLALKDRSTVIRNADGVPLAWLSLREGGNQIDYVDEDSQVQRMYREALATRGVTWRMEDVYASERAASA